MDFLKEITTVFAFVVITITNVLGNVYNVYAPSEGIYRVKNPYAKSQAGKITITSSNINYRPYYIKSSDEFFIYAPKASTYQLQTKNNQALKHPISTTNIITKKKFYKYSLPNYFLDNHWFHDIIPSDNWYIDSLIVEPALDSSNNILNLTLFSFSATKSSIRVIVNGKEHDYSLHGLSDKEFQIPYTARADGIVKVEIYAPFSTIGVRYYSINNINRHISYEHIFQRYNYKDILSYPDALNDQYDHFTFNKGAFRLIKSTKQINSKYFSNLLIHKRGSYKTLTPKLADLPIEKDSANYLILYHTKFHTLIPEIERIIQKNSSEKFSIQSISVQKIYNQLSYGAKSPEAIKTYLHRKNPTYVLFVGDANITADVNHDLIPIFYHIQDHKGTRVESDYLYTYNDIPTNPQFSIGRIPVSTLEELNLYLQKLQTYLTQSNPVKTLIYDDVKLLNKNTLSRMKDVVYTAPDHNFFTKLLEAPLVEYINDHNPATVIYAGHAAYSGWSDQNKIEINDFEDLSDNLLFPVIDLSCWTGTFANNTEDCLAEELLKLPDKGAVSIATFSGYSQLRSYGYIINYFLRNKTNYPMGELLNRLKVNLFEKNQISLDDIHAMNLLGIPSLPY